MPVNRKALYYSGTWEAFQDWWRGGGGGRELGGGGGGGLGANFEILRFFLRNCCIALKTHIFKTIGVGSQTPMPPSHPCSYGPVTAYVH